MTKYAIMTHVIDASSCARSKYGNFDDRVDQKVLDTTIASVISDPSNTFTEVSKVGSVDKAESGLAVSCGWVMMPLMNRFAPAAVDTKQGLSIGS